VLSALQSRLAHWGQARLEQQRGLATALIPVAKGRSAVLTDYPLLQQAAVAQRRLAPTTKSTLPVRENKKAAQPGGLSAQILRSLQAKAT
jgi:hypothetical protein